MGRLVREPEPGFRQQRPQALDALRGQSDLPVVDEQIQQQRRQDEPGRQG